MEHVGESCHNCDTVGPPAMIDAIRLSNFGQIRTFAFWTRSGLEQITVLKFNIVAYVAHLGLVIILESGLNAKITSV